MRLRRPKPARRLLVEASAASYLAERPLDDAGAGASSMTPRPRRRARSSVTGTLPAATPCLAASAAATPAASPVAKQVAVIRTDPFASCVLDTQRPAVSRLSSPAAIRQP